MPKLVYDFASALKAVDTSRRAHKSFRPGIGPFGEADAVREALAWLKASEPSTYGRALVKRHPDLLIPGEWALELKVVRPFGDNGRPAEHWSENVLHPYEGNTSALGDCLKLLKSKYPERKAVLVFGFEHTPPVLPLEPAMKSFELLALMILGIQLGPRIEELRDGLVHPVHQQLRVYGYEINPQEHLSGPPPDGCRAG